MTQTRRIQGEIVFPGDAGPGVAAGITIELRDVSLQDSPSTVVAATSLQGIAVSPNCRVPFGFTAPTVPSNCSLSLRVQVDMHPGRRHASGDFLSTSSQPVPATGDATGLVVTVTRL